MITDFTQLDAWRKAMDLAVDIRKATESFPKEELYGVISQMRRASISIAANIAEGFGRFTYADKQHKYVQARGELVEVMTFIHYCKRVGYLDVDHCLSLLSHCDEVHKLLNALIKSMRNKATLGPSS